MLQRAPCAALPSPASIAQSSTAHTPRLTPRLRTAWRATSPSAPGPQSAVHPLHAYPPPQPRARGAPPHLIATGSPPPHARPPPRPPPHTTARHRTPLLALHQANRSWCCCLAGLLLPTSCTHVCQMRAAPPHSLPGTRHRTPLLALTFAATRTIRSASSTPAESISGTVQSTADTSSRASAEAVSCANTRCLRAARGGGAAAGHGAGVHPPQGLAMKWQCQGPIKTQQLFESEWCLRARQASRHTAAPRACTRTSCTHVPS